MPARWRTSSWHVGLVEGEVDHPDLETTRWRDDQLLVFCGARHPLARKRALTDADLLAGTGSCGSALGQRGQAFDRGDAGPLEPAQGWS